MAQEIDPNLWSDYDHAKKGEEFWKKESARLAAEIGRLMGDEEEITVNGRKVGTYERIEGMNGKAFMKEYPELAEQFTTIVEKHELNKEQIKLFKPELYRQFQTRQLRRN
jgi:hypothetical protein